MHFLITLGNGILGAHGNLARLFGIGSIGLHLVVYRTDGGTKLLNGTRLLGGTLGQSLGAIGNL